jgi:hypothetical protein
MPLKTNVGVSRKVADNNYGSRGASVNLEVELDSSLINDPERFQDRIQQVFRLAQQAVDEELARYAGTQSQATAAGNTPAEPANAAPSNGHRNGHSASAKQLEYARQLAGQIKGLGVRKLESLASKMFGKPLAALTSMDASGLIDTLKAIKEGKISVEAALEGSTP